MRHYQTQGKLMIDTHGIPRVGSDYNKARDALVKYTDLGFYEGVDVRDKKIHKFLERITEKQPNLLKHFRNYLGEVYLNINVFGGLL